ncbi:hypothetical protein ACF0H5_008626 [Mactra antiquata]
MIKMDCLPLGMHVFLVPLIFCAINSVICQPFFPGPVPFRQQFGRPTFMNNGMLQKFHTYQPVRYYNNWNQVSNNFPVQQQRALQSNNNVIRRQQYNQVLSRDQSGPMAVQSVAKPVQTQQKPAYQYQGKRIHPPMVKPVNTPQISRFVTRPSQFINKSNISTNTKKAAQGGILTKVIPHPKQRMYNNMSTKKRLRLRAVAKAKSFPGILKNTALENKRV